MGALEGLLVVAVEQAVAAPLCTSRLVEAGARVIKVERAGGETARHYDSVVEGTSAYFAWLNAGKESAVVDLKTDAGLSLLRTMIERADVLVQNLSPGAMDRMGLDEAALSALNPRLISLGIVGYDQGSSFADMRAYDALVQAESGICAVTGEGEVAAKVGVSIADIGTGLYAHAAILEALIQRGITGKGQHLSVSMFDCMANWMTVPLLQYQHGGKAPHRAGLAHASIYPYGPFRCADGTILLSIQTQREWVSLCEEALGLPELVSDPRFIDNMARSANRQALDAAVNPVFLAMTKADCAARLKAAGVAFGALSEVADLPGHDALQWRQVRLDNGSLVNLPALPARAAGNPLPLPRVGEHSEAILQEFGGVDSQR